LNWDDATGRQRQNSQPWILQPLTVLVGRNSTGKTSFLDALSFVSRLPSL
jgi:AAA15 family ATPase/GTPase